MKWKVLGIYSWHDGPVTFTAAQEDAPWPHPYLFRWAGGDGANRLFESDCHSKMRTPFYIKEDDLDYSECEDFQKVDSTNAV